MAALRWIVDDAHDGATNMARDEALLHLVGDGLSPPTLRFYRWSPATISLGYFQSIAEFEALAPPAGGLAVVRRQTGGGAILHDLELTYSLTLPLDHALVGCNPNCLYTHVHGAFSGILQRLGVPVAGGPAGGAGCSHGGPFFCFERHGALDVLARGEKILGSAQRRTQTAVLQHGSLILDSRYPQQRCATVRAFSTADFEPLLPELAAAIAAAPVGSPGRFTTSELERAATLFPKYAGPEWLHKR